MNSWMILSATEGTGNKQFTIGAEDLNSTAMREGVVTVTEDSGRKANVRAVQYGKPSIDRRQPYDDVNAAGGSASISITSYGEWCIVGVPSLPDWVTILTDEGDTYDEGDWFPPCGYSKEDCPDSTSDLWRTFSVGMGQNTTTLSRSVRLKLRYERLDGNITDSDFIEIRQQGIVKDIDVPSTPTTKGETTGGETTWVATTDADWITITKRTGNRGEQVIFETLENIGDAREGIITITYSDGTVELMRVRQAEQTEYLDINTNYIVINPQGDEVTVTVESNICWKVENQNIWIRLNPIEGCNDGTVTIAVGVNEGAERSATIRFYNEEYGIEKILTLTQGMCTMKLFYTSTDSNIINFDNINAYTPWADERGTEYFTFTNTYGEDGGVIEFSGSPRILIMAIGEQPRLKSFGGMNGCRDELFFGRPLEQFKACPNLEEFSINLEEGSLPYVHEYSSGPYNRMFENCDKLRNVHFGSFFSGFGYDVEPLLRNTVEMFKNCTSLQTLTLEMAQPVEVVSTEMFMGCTNLTSLDIKGSLVAGYRMFMDCTSLTSIDLTKFVTIGYLIYVSGRQIVVHRDMTEMFKNCVNLSRVKVGNKNKQQYSLSTDMFANVSPVGVFEYPRDMSSTLKNFWRGLLPEGWTEVAY